MQRALIIFTTLALTALSVDASAQTKAEKFEYAVTWGYSDVARMTIKRGCPKGGYTPHMLSARSTGVAEQLHEFQVRLDSFADPDGRSLEGRTFVKEDGIPRFFRTRFAEDGSARVQKRFKKRENVLDLTFRGQTHDLLSWSFALRSRELKPGTTITYHIWDGWKLARLEARVKKTERLWTPSDTYQAYRIDLVRTRLHHRGEKAYEPKADTRKLGVLWLADDDLHTPVGMDFDAPVGVAKIRLQRMRRVDCSR